MMGMDIEVAWAPLGEPTPSHVALPRYATEKGSDPFLAHRTSAGSAARLSALGVPAGVITGKHVRHVFDFAQEVSRATAVFSRI